MGHLCSLLSTSWKSSASQISEPSRSEFEPTGRLPRNRRSDYFGTVSSNADGKIVIVTPRLERERARDFCIWHMGMC